MLLIVFAWLRDWVVRLFQRWAKAAEAKLEEMKEDRWVVILEVMKVMMFLVMLFPLVVVINYIFDENASDPAPGIFTTTMPYVFIVITLWYMLAAIIYGIYFKNKEDIEKDNEKRLAGGT